MKQDGERVAWIQFWRDNNKLVLSYRVRRHGEEWQDIEQPTPIVWMPCRFGGTRPYFVCPGIVSGIACGRQVAKLYGDGTTSCPDPTGAAPRSRAHLPPGEMTNVGGRQFLLTITNVMPQN
jgi:hypothetical protein